MVGRETLLEVAAAGPAAGAAASLVAVGVGLALSAGGSGGIQFEPGAFDDSLLIGGLGARSALLAQLSCIGFAEFQLLRCTEKESLMSSISTALASRASLQWESGRCFFLYR